MSKFEGLLSGKPVTPGVRRSNNSHPASVSTCLVVVVPPSHGVHSVLLCVRSQSIRGEGPGPRVGRGSVRPRVRKPLGPPRRPYLKGEPVDSAVGQPLTVHAPFVDVSGSETSDAGDGGLLPRVFFRSFELRANGRSLALVPQTGVRGCCVPLTTSRLDLYGGRDKCSTVGPQT